MAKWIQLACAGLLGVLGACRPFGSQSMPDSRFSTVDFTPDGGRILVDSYFSKQIYLYDLVAKDYVWRLPARQIGGASFSPAGRFAVFVEQNANDPTAQLSVIRLADGVKSAFARGLRTSLLISDRYFSEQAVNLTAVSDDGAWVILAYGGAPLEVYSTANGRLLYQATTPDAVVVRVLIEPGNRRVAVLQVTKKETNINILEHENGQWRVTNTVAPKSILLQAWTSGGLALLTRRGIELWSGGEPRLVAPLVQGPDEYDVYAVDSVGTPCIFFSPDGAFAAASTYDRFDVFDLKTGAKIFSHSERDESMKSSDSGLLRAAAFTGRHLRGFLQTGNFVDVDLSIPQIVKTISFGSRGHYSKNWFTDGSSWESNYQSRFGPDGRYIDIYQEASGHEIYPLP